MNSEDRLSAHVTINKQGRIVIPRRLRQALCIGPDEDLIARVRDGRLEIEKPQTVLARIRTRFANVPAEVSLVDELLAERREAARRENEDAEWLKLHPPASS